MSVQSIKQYDTYMIACQYKSDAGDPLPISGLTIKSQLRTQTGDLLDDLTVEPINEENGHFYLIPTVAELPPGVHLIDVLFIKGGARVSSETFAVEVKGAITAFKGAPHG